VSLTESDCTQGDCTQTKPKLPGEVWVLIAANAVIALGYGVVAPVQRDIERADSLAYLLPLKRLPL
jgi:hypothetical protein